MKYISVKEASKKWGITERRVRILCSENRIDGVVKTSWAWNIPSTAEKPSDGRTIRHIKNIDLRVDSFSFNELLNKQNQFNKIISNSEKIREYFDDSINRFLLVALNEENFNTQDILNTFNNIEDTALKYKEKMLVLNAKSILINFYKQTGFGPILPYCDKATPFISEKRINEIYQDLYRNVDDYYLPKYRVAKVSNPSSYDLKEYDVSIQIETLMFQYENEWSLLNPLVKACFMFAGLLRINPYKKHNFLLASIIFAAILLENNFPLSIIPISVIEELRANLALTLSQSNYTKLINLFESYLINELDVILSI